MGKEDKVVMDEELQLQEDYLKGKISRIQYEQKMQRLIERRDEKLQLLGLCID